MTSPPAYKLRWSQRARGMRLEVSSNGVVVLTARAGTPLSAIERFFSEKEHWVRAKVAYFVKHPRALIPAKRGDFNKYVETARVLVTQRVAYWNSFYGYSIGRITIRNQKTRWGSCSKKGNLSFSYKLALLPPALSDYIIVHELCHRGQFNHSTAFWALVARTIPNYVARRRALNKTDVRLF